MLVGLPAGRGRGLPGCRLWRRLLPAGPGGGDPGGRTTWPCWALTSKWAVLAAAKQDGGLLGRRQQRQPAGAACQPRPGAVHVRFPVYAEFAGAPGPTASCCRWMLGPITCASCRNHLLTTTETRGLEASVPAGFEALPGESHLYAEAGGARGDRRPADDDAPPFGPTPRAEGEGADGLVKLHRGGCTRR